MRVGATEHTACSVRRCVAPTITHLITPPHSPTHPNPSMRVQGAHKHTSTRTHPNLSTFIRFPLSLSMMSPRMTRSGSKRNPSTGTPCSVKRVYVCECVCVCVSIGLTEHTDRGLARVGLTNVCVCVCVCTQTLVWCLLLGLWTCKQGARMHTRGTETYLLCERVHTVAVR